ncbi:hypothetical protein U3516DRAFT_789494, partial [Neocallimastix sp. 'constans']
MNINDKNFENINNEKDINNDSNENDDINKNKKNKHGNKNNINVINIRSSLHLKSYETEVFYNMVTFGRIGRIPKSIELIFILFESLQLNFLLY